MERLSQEQREDLIASIEHQKSEQQRYELEERLLSEIYPWVHFFPVKDDGEGVHWLEQDLIPEDGEKVLRQLQLTFNELTDTFSVKGYEGIKYFLDASQYLVHNPQETHVEITEEMNRLYINDVGNLCEKKGNNHE
jgi:hypothetical protein